MKAFYRKIIGHNSENSDIDDSGSFLRDINTHRTAERTLHFPMDHEYHNIANKTNPEHGLMCMKMSVSGLQITANQETRKSSVVLTSAMMYRMSLPKTEHLMLSILFSYDRNINNQNMFSKNAHLWLEKNSSVK